MIWKLNSELCCKLILIPAIIRNLNCILIGLIRSDQISRSVVSDSMRPHESQHARPPCPSPTPGVHSDSHPSSQWCHPAISSSAIPLSSCPQSLPASESLLLSRFSHVRLCATPEMTAHQAPPSLGFSRQEHWSSLPFPSPMHESEKWKWSCSVVSNS